LADINWREVASVQENDILEVKENRSMVTQQKTVKEYDQRQYSVNDLQREKLSENSRFVYSKINSCLGQRPYNGI
jgi:hypothetical protein